MVRKFIEDFDNLFAFYSSEENWNLLLSHARKEECTPTFWFLSNLFSKKERKKHSNILFKCELWRCKHEVFILGAGNIYGPILETHLSFLNHTRFLNSYQQHNVLEAAKLTRILCYNYLLICWKRKNNSII